MPSAPAITFYPKLLMKVVRDVDELLRARSSVAAELSVGYVATMGSLHAGHTSLIDLSKKRTDVTFVSIFVNPKQFAANEDLSTYPRDVAADLTICREHGVDVVFIPETPEVMYPVGFSTLVTCAEGDASRNERSEGAKRPTFFQGVATVLTRLFIIMRPSKVFFGQKDAQQCAVVNRLVSDLFAATELVVGDIVREDDGLALSSRNVYLSVRQRAQAPVIYMSLKKAQITFNQDQGVSSNLLKEIVTTTIKTKQPEVIIDYVSVCDRWTMVEIEREIPASQPCMLCVTVRIGTTRLLDNVVLRS